MVISLALFQNSPSDVHRYYGVRQKHKSHLYRECGSFNIQFKIKEIDDKTHTN